MTYLLARTIAVLVTSFLTKVGVPLVFAWQTGAIALGYAVVLAVINAVIKPGISTLAFPITLLTLGAFSLVINGLMVALAAYVVPGFNIPSFLMAVVFAVVLSMVNFVLHPFE